MGPTVRVLLMACILALASGNALANVAACLLENLPGSTNEATTTAAIQLCYRDHPREFFEIERGSGKMLWGMVGLSDPQSCVLKHAKTTANQRGAVVINRVCHCLYGAPSFQGERCAYPPVPAQAQPPAVTAPVDDRPASIPNVQLPTAAVAVAPPLPATPVRQPPPQPTAEELRYKAQVQADLDAAAQRAIQDFPYLNTPAGKDAMDKIVRRRDELIQQGVYPSIALARAVQAFAAAMAPRQTVAREAAPPALSPQGGHAGFDPKCRWATPTQWTCD